MNEHPILIDNNRLFVNLTGRCLIDTGSPISIWHQPMPGWKWIRKMNNPVMKHSEGYVVPDVWDGEFLGVTRNRYVASLSDLFLSGMYPFMALIGLDVLTECNCTIDFEKSIFRVGGKDYLSRVGSVWVNDKKVGK